MIVAGGLLRGAAIREGASRVRGPRVAESEREKASGASRSRGRETKDARPNMWQRMRVMRRSYFHVRGCQGDTADPLHLLPNRPLSVRESVCAKDEEDTHPGNETRAQLAPAVRLAVVCHAHASALSPPLPSNSRSCSAVQALQHKVAREEASTR